MNCRFCNNNLGHVFVDLVNSPLSNSYLVQEQLNEPEAYYPLKLLLCENCFLVQIDEYRKSKDIFNENYAYFSSYSTAGSTIPNDMLIPLQNALDTTNTLA